MTPAPVGDRWRPGSAPLERGPGGRPSGVRGPGRRSVPHLALGALLVLGCATGFAVVTTRTDHRVPVLALARPVGIGHVLTSADVQVVQLTPGAGVATVAASEESSVLGQPVAYALPGGVLLTPAELGSAAQPPVGQAIAAVAVKPGQYPPGLAPGVRVLLVLAAAGGPGSPLAPGGPSSTGPWPASVVSVLELASEQGAVVTVQLPAAAAPTVAALSGSIAIVLAH